MPVQYCSIVLVLAPALQRQDSMANTLIKYSAKLSSQLMLRATERLSIGHSMRIADDSLARFTLFWRPLNEYDTPPKMRLSRHIPIAITFIFKRNDLTLHLPSSIS